MTFILSPPREISSASNIWQRKFKPFVMILCFYESWNHNSECSPPLHVSIYACKRAKAPCWRHLVVEKKKQGKQSWNFLNQNYKHQISIFPPNSLRIMQLQKQNRAWDSVAYLDGQNCIRELFAICLHSKYNRTNPKRNYEDQIQQTIN